MTRNTAKSGDFVAVTGQIGNSIAGLEISEKDNTIPIIYFNLKTSPKIQE